jgi:hypothetical protein
MAPLSKELTDLLGRPPIYHLMATADPFSGEDQHLNPAWRGLVSFPMSTEPSIPMAIKYLGQSSVKIAVELACGFAALALKLPVPKPALVYCNRRDLPALPQSVTGDVLLLFGSSFTPEDTIWARAKLNSAFAEELIWQRVCEDIVGSKGAAWDELIANPDRHHNNLIFDGLKWWLFDHDKAIPPVAQIVDLQISSVLLKEFPDFVSRANILAQEMLKRRPNDHAIEKQPAQFDKQRDQLKAVAVLLSAWKTEDPRLQGILTDAALLAGLIASRLPSLALHLSRRLGGKDGESLWT